MAAESASTGDTECELAWAGKPLSGPDAHTQRTAWASPGLSCLSPGRLVTGCHLLVSQEKSGPSVSEPGRREGGLEGKGEKGLGLPTWLDNQA